MVLYTLLDCLDGKQARRTGTSSPLGQLFDHGCDALSVNMLLANIACSLSIGCSWAHALGNLGVMFTWVLAQWEEYHTGLMLYGNSFYGVLECNYTLASVHLVTLALGPEFWRTPLVELLPAVAQLPVSGLQHWSAYLCVHMSPVPRVGCVPLYTALQDAHALIWAGVGQRDTKRAHPQSCFTSRALRRDE